MEYCTYTTNEDQEPVAITRAEYDKAGGLPEDWEDYIWHDADSKGEAIERHDQRHDEYMAKQAGMTVENYINWG
jgi:PHD/YefM family antitoxin component YafN of YafNO toxin-antitoxin module